MEEATRPIDIQAERAGGGADGAVLEAVAAGYRRRAVRSGVHLVAGECLRSGCGELVAAAAGPVFCGGCAAEVLEDLRPLFEGYAQLDAEDRGRVDAMARALVRNSEGGRR